MTNDIREKAEALVMYLEGENCCNTSSRQFKDLKEALHPSREEIIEGLSIAILSFEAGTVGHEAIANAIEELKK